MVAVNPACSQAVNCIENVELGVRLLRRLSCDLCLRCDLLIVVLRQSKNLPFKLFASLAQEIEFYSEQVSAPETTVLWTPRLVVVL